MVPNSPSPIHEDRCPECGASVAGGRAACEALFDEIRYQALNEPRIGAVRRLAFDTYCMQHVETYCVSAKSYAAHLTGLCCGIEFDGDPAIYTAIPRWLDGKVTLEKPPIKADRGALTIADVWALRGVEDRVNCIHAWANDIWAVYTEQHEIARAWVRAARAHKTAR